MKKISFLLISILAFSFAKAQDIPLIDAGVRLGVNVATLGNLPDGVESEGPKLGLVAGAFGRVNIPVIGIFAQPEITFSQTGGRISSINPNSGEPTNNELNLNNLDFTLLVGKRVGFGPLGVRFGVGPNFTTVLSAKDKDGNDIETFDNESLFGLQVGVGVDISKLNIDLRYQATFTNLVDNNSLEAYRPNAIQLTVGYKIF